MVKAASVAFLKKNFLARKLIQYFMEGSIGHQHLQRHLVGPLLCQMKRARSTMPPFLQQQKNLQQFAVAVD